MGNERKTNQPHEYTCGWCEKLFTSSVREQLIAKNAGRAVYCSKECAVARVRAQPAPWRGPCVHCGKMFRAQGLNRRYCTMACYHASPECRQRLQEQSVAIGAAKVEQSGTAHLVGRLCVVCQKTISVKNRHRDCCSRQCWRQYFAERFDRFVANPEAIALPQNFDEFLSQTELPCLVDGCDWVGVRLGQHVNFSHGITADQFRELAGFNKTSGLVGVEESRARSAIAKQLVDDGKTGHGFFEHLAKVRAGEAITPQRQPSNTLEASEHRAKSHALRAATKPLIDKVCEHCQKPYQVTVLAHPQKFCCVRCRSLAAKARTASVAELICSFCGRTFMGNLFKVRRAQQQLNVTCSDDCRNKMNIRACLASRVK